MLSRDLKTWAREVLSGHWSTAVVVCLVAGLLAGGIDMVSAVFQESSQNEAFGMLDLAANDAWPIMVTVTAVSLLVAVVIGGAITLGTAHYFTNLAARRPSKFGDLFSRFSIWHKGIWMSIVIAFFVMLWTLLGILPGLAVITYIAITETMQTSAMVLAFCLFALGSIPGVIATYRYAMIPYLLAEFPDLSVMDAMRESKRLMQGNKWRLFCLSFSFFGWVFVALLTLGIAFLWIEPYMQAANAAFYLEVTGRAELRYPQPEQEA